jgi:hypothetical protein
VVDVSNSRFIPRNRLTQRLTAGYEYFTFSFQSPGNVILVMMP